MLIEALVKPLRVSLPQDGGEILLHPGTPVELPAKTAWKLLRQAQGRVRLARPLTADWLTLWRFVAEASSGLEPGDPRLSGVLTAIGSCDGAFMQDNKTAFLVAIEEVMQAMETHADQCGLF